jgi:hypothetical protein
MPDIAVMRMILRREGLNSIMVEIRPSQEKFNKN